MSKHLKGYRWAGSVLLVLLAGCTTTPSQAPAVRRVLPHGAFHVSQAQAADPLADPSMMSTPCGAAQQGMVEQPNVPPQQPDMAATESAIPAQSTTMPQQSTGY